MIRLIKVQAAKRFTLLCPKNFPYSIDLLGQQGGYNWFNKKVHVLRNSKEFSR